MDICVLFIQTNLTWCKIVVCFICSNIALLSILAKPNHSRRCHDWFLVELPIFVIGQQTQLMQRPVFCTLHFRAFCSFSYFVFCICLYFVFFSLPPDWWANRCDKQTGGSSCWCGQTDSQSEAEKAADCLTNITNVLFLTNITNVPFLTNTTNVRF